VSARPEVIAHRGFSAIAPENTLRAFEEAIACGADRVELDVALTRDGVPVVIHDDLLDRTTDGRGPLCDIDWDALRRLDAGTWFGAGFRGERVPSLDEVLDLTLGRIPLNVEIKAGLAAPAGPVAGSRDVPGLEAKVARAIAVRDLTGAVIVSSFDPRAIERIRMIEPRIETERLHDGAEGPPGAGALDRARALGAAGLNVSLDELRRAPDLPREARARGLRLKVYTVDEPADMEEVIALGVDGIFTNRPDRLIGILGRSTRPPRPLL
jgi:glycerophosphoryl diester phosphodiesterase